MLSHPTQAMLVLDASAFVDFLDPTKDLPALDIHLASDTHWVVPEHFLIEVTQALRGLWLRGGLTEPQLDRALDALAAAHFDVWPTRPLLPRVRELMPNASAYDAAYVALAEEIASPLLTMDAKLTRVPGAQCAFVGT